MAKSKSSKTAPRQAKKRATRVKAASSRKPAGKVKAGSSKRPARLYTLEAFVPEVPLMPEFIERSPVISRTIQIRGDQSLEDLHFAIFDAFDRFDEHMYEFQVGGKGPMDPKARRYVMSMAADNDVGDDQPVAGCVEEASVESVGLKPGEASATGLTSATTGGTRSTSRASRTACRRESIPR